MKNRKIDVKLIIGIVLAYLLIFITFESIKVFWYLYTATMLFLISYTIINEKIDDELPPKKYFLIGIISGILLYFIFATGNWFLSYMPGNLNNQVTKIYDRLSLELAWHYLVLIFIIVPGEEFFWRGFVQKRLLSYLSVPKAIFVTAIINGAAFFVSGYPVLMLAAFVSSLVWGTLYVWKRSLPLLIISHLAFDILLLIIFPLL